MSEYAVPRAGTIAAEQSKTFDRGFTSLIIDNSNTSSGNVTVAYYRNGTATGESYTIEPGKNRTWGAGNIMWDQFIATCAASTTAFYEYLP